MTKEKRALTRITINLPTGVLEKVDKWAKQTGLSRTTAITIMCADFFANLEVKDNKDEV